MNDDVIIYRHSKHLILLWMVNGEPIRDIDSAIHLRLAYKSSHLAVMNDSLSSKFT